MSCILGKRSTSTSETPSMFISQIRNSQALRSIMDKLPPVLVQSFTNFLPYSDIVQVQLTCKAWSNWNKIEPTDKGLYLDDAYLSKEEMVPILEKFTKIASVKISFLDDRENDNKVIIEKLAQHSTLRHLEITGNFSNNCLEELTFSTSIKSINLDYTFANDESLALLAKIKGLTKISLVGTQITDKGLIHLHNLKKLKEIDLSYCLKITSNGLLGFEFERTMDDAPSLIVHKEGISSTV